MLKYVRIWFQNMSYKKYSFRQIIVAATGSGSGIAIVAYLSLDHEFALLVPSFGASAVLLYAAHTVPMAQPKNIIGGHLISALTGVTMYQLGGLSWWSMAIGVSLAIIGMMLTDTLHPPGGATAFAAVFTRQDYTFILSPVFWGAVILVLVAVIVHNLWSDDGYPNSLQKHNKPGD